MSVSQPFFILGNPRSGTSLFRLMLNNHPKIVVPPECGFSEWLYDEFGHKELNEKIYLNFLSALFNAKKFETWGVDYEDILSSINERKPKTYQDLVSEIYLGYARKLGKKVDVFGDKNNYYINHVGKIEKIFPSCKKIFIVRDGRDVACSYLDLKDKYISSSYRPNLTDNILDIAREWRKSVEIMMSWSGKGTLQIQYEELVKDPHANLSKVCDFLSLAYSEDMLDYYKNNDEPEEFKAWKGKTFEPVEVSSVARYKSDLNRDQIQAFESIAGDALESAGYEV